MAKTHVPYPPAFRAEAVELARTSGKGIPQLASDLGISEQALRGWMKRADIDAGRGQPGDLTTGEREELRRFRRENHVLKQERDILRKAAAYFAKETLVYCDSWFGGGGEAVETQAAGTASHRVAPATDGLAPVWTVSSGLDHASRGKTRAAHRAAAPRP